MIEEKPKIEFKTLDELRVHEKCYRELANPYRRAHEYDIFEKNGYVSLRMYFGGTYDIEVTRLNSSCREWVDWIYHLMGKPWMTPERLWVFLRLIEKHRPDRSQPDRFELGADVPR